MTITSVTLDTPIASVGPARTAFFNGRLLAAEDLQREQLLSDAGQARVAALVGCGIARGLEVSDAGEDAVKIEPGVGVTPSGQVISFPGATVSLATGSSSGLGRGTFVDCAGALAGSVNASGLYVLALTPAWVASGQAATILGEAGSCNRKLETPATRVKLLELIERPEPGVDGTDGDPIPDDTGVGHLSRRNRLAASLLSSRARLDPLIGWLPSGGVPRLSEHDLPLAVVKLDPDPKQRFIDIHAVQRRLAPPPGGAGDRLWRHSWAIEMEAFALQFVNQLSELLAVKFSEVTNSVAVYFPYLPPLFMWNAETKSAALIADFVRFGLFAEHAPVSAVEFHAALDTGLRSEVGRPNESDLFVRTFHWLEHGGSNLVFLTRSGPGMPFNPIRGHGRIDSTGDGNASAAGSAKAAQSGKPGLLQIEAKRAPKGGAKRVRSKRKSGPP